MLGYGYDDISALRDMFDGGGAGQAGAEFQGGGILSLLANMLASPYGSQQEDDQLARRIAGQASPRPQMAPDSSMRPPMRPQGSPDDYMRAGQMTTGEELMRPQGRPDDYMRAGQMTTGEELMSGAPTSVPAALRPRTGALDPQAESVLQMFRDGRVTPGSPNFDFGQLIDVITTQGNSEQLAELQKILEDRTAKSGN